MASKKLRHPHNLTALLHRGGCQLLTLSVTTRPTRPRGPSWWKTIGSIQLKRGPFVCDCKSSRYLRFHKAANEWGSLWPVRCDSSWLDRLLIHWLWSISWYIDSSCNTVYETLNQASEHSKLHRTFFVCVWMMEMASVSCLYSSTSVHWGYWHLKAVSKKT